MRGYEDVKYTWKTEEQPEERRRQWVRSPRGGPRGTAFSYFALCILDFTFHDFFYKKKDNNGAQGRQVLKKSPCCRRSSGLSGFPTVEDWLPSSPVLSWGQLSYKKDRYYKLELQPTSTLVVSSEKGVFSSIFSAASVDRNLCPGMKSTPVTSLNTVLSSS